MEVNFLKYSFCTHLIWMLKIKSYKKINFKKKKIMINELKKVISKVEKLKDEEQRQIAKMLEDEINWDFTLQNSQEKLNILAKEAIHEYKNRKTEQTDW